MNDPKPKTCPFCGNTEDFDVVDLSVGDQWTVVCVCGANGPTASTKEEAAKLWNTRAKSELP